MTSCIYLQEQEEAQCGYAYLVVFTSSSSLSTLKEKNFLLVLVALKPLVSLIIMARHNL